MIESGLPARLLGSSFVMNWAWEKKAVKAAMTPRWLSGKRIHVESAAQLTYNHTAKRLLPSIAQRPPKCSFNGNIETIGVPVVPKVNVPTYAGILIKPLL